ncbi:class I SAM-dependent methyltransferase [Nocardia crassostreae]|uniref:class I SAM-dependent methyltransferase n=1 Tax=Nocardia crassostreae TaxID=53428 RepID=UPI0009FDE7C8|nr:class I SAM-dependent methyltransferase [Nocardia crassostreae]
MPTIRPEDSNPAVVQAHRQRQVAESFGVDVERYDRTRPHYPDELIRRIADNAREVLDVGCGTGIAARQLQAAGCTVLGVEPDSRMADFARARGLDTEVATFENWDPAGRRFDAVTAGQAWHWVNPVVGAAKAAESLRPGGRLTAFWYVLTTPPEVTDAFTTAYTRATPDSPFRFPTTPDQTRAMYQTMLDNAATGIREAGGFTEPEQWRFDADRTFTRAQWLDQLPTLGVLTRLPPDALTEITYAVGTAIDAIGGHFTVPFTTVAVTAERITRTTN